MNICKYCKSADIICTEEQENIIYKNKNFDIFVDISTCQQCKREFFSREQILKNDAKVRDVKKSADGLLTSTEILTARTELGLTQEEAAKVFGGGRHAFSRYERAVVSQSFAMDKLIRICLKYPNVFNEILSNSGIHKG
jgi:HTH-type transcriptional regulator/antitoxin MqsA